MIAPYLLARILPQGFEQTVEWVSTDGLSVETSGRGSWNDLPGYEAPSRILLVPGESVLVTRIHVPSRRKSQIIQAVPYLLEEQLVGDLDASHFAIGSDRGGQNYPVAVVAHAEMQGWLEEARDHGLEKQVIPDFLALPFEEHSWTMVCEDARILLRTGHDSGYAILPDTLPVLLESLETEVKDSNRPKIICYAAEKQLRSAQELLTDWQASGGEVVYRTLRHSWLIQCITEIPSQLPSWSLAQNSYTPMASSRSKRFLWVAAGLLLFNILIHTGSQWLTWQKLYSTNQQLTRQREQRFHDAFPGIKKLVNLPAQAEAEINRLRRMSASNGETGWMDMLSVLGTAMNGLNAYEVEALTYQNGQLEVRMALDSLQSFEQVQNRVNAHNLYELSVISVQQTDNGIQMRVQMKS